MPHARGDEPQDDVVVVTHRDICPTHVGKAPNHRKSERISPLALPISVPHAPQSPSLSAEARCRCIAGSRRRNCAARAFGQGQCHSCYLGHSDIQTTLKYYVHLVDDDKIATAETMGDILAGCSEKCLQEGESTQNKIISINSILDEKCAIK